MQYFPWPSQMLAVPNEGNLKTFDTVVMHVLNDKYFQK